MASGERSAAGRARPRGRVSSTITSRQGAAAATDQNAARQAPASANMPPTAGPASVAMPHIAEISPMPRGHSRSGNSARTIE
jgi:hypothetical protein